MNFIKVIPLNELIYIVMNDKKGWFLHRVIRRSDKKELILIYQVSGDVYHLFDGEIYLGVANQWEFDWFNSLYNKKYKLPILYDIQVGKSHAGYTLEQYYYELQRYRDILLGKDVIQIPEEYDFDKEDF